MVKQKGKKIVNVGFIERKSMVLFQYSSEYKELDGQYLAKFCAATLL